MLFVPSHSQIVAVCPKTSGRWSHLLISTAGFLNLRFQTLTLQDHVVERAPRDIRGRLGGASVGTEEGSRASQGMGSCQPKGAHGGGKERRRLPLRPGTSASLTTLETVSFVNAAELRAVLAVTFLPSGDRCKDPLAKMLEVSQSAHLGHPGPHTISHQ